ncbi:MAG: FG-GAP repeat protein [Thermoanaerobaculia bacterium]|nr:FG-GAP repeat protein [Thermoanaerobaculia bacterium]MBP9823611.1 FG-GAP repeat protein [Thermoanaerobaculia bacterium]
MSRSLLALSLAVPVSLAIVHGAPVGAQRPAIGLSAAHAQLWLETGTGPESPGQDDYFGFALAVGDFNHDGYDDLAMGVPGNDWLPEIADVGSVQVRFGAPAGALGLLLPVLPWNNAVDPAEALDAYGRALAAGDFDGDGYDDLAVGIPSNDYVVGSTVISMGGVHLHYGLPNELGRLQPVAEYSFSQAPGGLLPGSPAAGERFGEALAFGDFNGDGKDDLAIGIPGDAANCPAGLCRAGAVMVVDQNAEGSAGGYLMRFGLEGLPGVPGALDQFGGAVATGDFNGDGFDDLAIGIPQVAQVGAVLVVYGSPFSLIFVHHQLFDQGAFGELPETGDQFGTALAAGDFNGDGFADLAMGAPFEDGAGPEKVDSGQVIVSYGTAGGLSTVAAPWLSEDGIWGSGSEINDQFGSALAAGDFDGDGFDELVIGAAHESVSGTDGYGAVTVIRGRAAGLAGSATRWLWPGAFPIGMIPGETNVGSHYGSALVSGDFDGNGLADLAIGGPERSLFSSDTAASQAGSVAVLFGQLFIDGFESHDALEWSAVAP